MAWGALDWGCWGTGGTLRASNGQKWGTNSPKTANATVTSEWTVLWSNGKHRIPQSHDTHGTWCLGLGLLGVQEVLKECQTAENGVLVPKKQQMPLLQVSERFFEATVGIEYLNRMIPMERGALEWACAWYRRRNRGYRWSNTGYFLIQLLLWLFWFG